MGDGSGDVELLAAHGTADHPAIIIDIPLRALRDRRHRFDGKNRILTCCGLARKHDGRRAVVNCIRDIRRFRSRRTRVVDHRIQHLRGCNADLSHRLRHLDHSLLEHRNFLERHLDAEISAGNHDAVRFLQNLLQIGDALHALDFRDDQRMASVFLQNLTNVADILRGSCKGCGHKFKALLASEDEVFSVLVADERHREVGSRDVDSLVIRNRSSIENRAVYFLSFHGVNPHADESVIDHDLCPRLHVPRQVLVRDGTDVFIAKDLFIGREGEFLSFLQHDFSVLEITGADLRSFRVKKGRDWKVQFTAELQNFTQTCSVLGVRSVREIEARDIHAREHELTHCVFIITCRSQCAYYFRLAHRCSLLLFCSVIFRYHILPPVRQRRQSC